ncbi:MAG: hypothetical protein JST04_17670 [Bdellovibrionales bacterium]|nr:hypothetical protein [Bdellovibrionales bacterium]
MSWLTYATTVPGKWCLAGEHAVLRGGAAVLMPHPEFRLKLEFCPGEGNFLVEPDLATPAMHDLLRVAKGWLANRGAPMEMPRGTLKITSSIPFGAGLGSSAALSVATARWVLSAHSLDRALERDLARELENQFHGRSSGMDVAVVSIGEPIRFTMAEGAVGLGISHLPAFVFVDSGLRASTRECIAKVEALRKRDADRADRLDGEMRRATEEVLAGLRAYDEAVGRKSAGARAAAMEEIAKGMRRANGVYAEWGLVPEEARRLLERLESEGVRAPRITGAGDGGFIVGLK